MLQHAPIAIEPSQQKQYLHSLAIAQLRQGEQENCVAHHTPQSCLFPLSGEGVHQQPKGAQLAYNTYLRILKIDPQDFSARWLLNIAAMAGGLYPDRIPKKWKIPEQAFQSGQAFPRFPNVAKDFGIDALGLAGGVVFDDSTGDGRLDLVVSSWGQSDQLRFFVKTASGFKERTKEAGLTGLTGGLNLIHADYDNDGDNDIFVLRGAWRFEAGRIPNSLLQNNGKGTFIDVTVNAGLAQAHPTQTAVWADFDNDGQLDLFIGNESHGQSIHPAQLFENQGHGRFRDISRSAGVALQGFIKGVAAGDFNNDLKPDLYVSYLDRTNQLFENISSKPGEFAFRDVTKRAGVAASNKSFPTWFFDYNNDGWLDIFVLGYRASPGDVAKDYLGLRHDGMRPFLYENQKNGRFRDVTRKRKLDHALLAMGCNFGDLDNDGWLDFYVGTGDPNLTSIMPNRMFRNDRGRRFVDVTSAGGFGHLQKGHGVAFVDFDEDGDQDVYAVLGGAYSGDVFTNALFQNPGNSNHWIKLLLRGTRSNRSAIGARIKISLKKREIHMTVSSGGSFGGSALRQSIGLGRAEEIESITINWPSGQTQILRNIQADQQIEIIEPR